MRTDSLARLPISAAIASVKCTRRNVSASIPSVDRFALERQTVAHRRDRVEHPAALDTAAVLEGEAFDCEAVDIDHLVRVKFGHGDVERDRIGVATAEVVHGCEGLGASLGGVDGQDPLAPDHAHESEQGVQPAHVIEMAVGVENRRNAAQVDLLVEQVAQDTVAGVDEHTGFRSGNPDMLGDSGL